MYIGLKHLHSGLAYLALLALVVVFIYAFVGAISNKEFTEKSRKFALIAFILAHIQLLVGLILYVVSPVGLSLLSGAAMKDSAARLTSLEHPLINIFAIVLITIGYSRAKKLEENKAKFRSVYLFYGIGLFFIISRIPWANWLG